MAVVVIVGLVIAAIVGGAVLLGSLSASPQSTGSVPQTLPFVRDYVGSTLSEVEAEAAANEWELVVSEEHRSSLEAGTIAEQAPTSGALAPGDELHLVVSLGPEPATVPTLVGLTAEEAVSALTEANLAIGDLTKEVDNEVAAGLVLAAHLDGEALPSEVTPGTAIDLVISAGAGAREPLPSFVGLSLGDALAQADALELTVVQEQAPNAIYDEGYVFDHSPPTGAPFAPGDELVLILSLGPPSGSSATLGE